MIFHSKFFVGPSAYWRVMLWWSSKCHILQLTLDNTSPRYTTVTTIHQYEVKQMYLQNILQVTFDVIKVTINGFSVWLVMLLIGFFFFSHFVIISGSSGEFIRKRTEQKRYIIHVKCLDPLIFPPQTKNIFICFLLLLTWFVWDISISRFYSTMKSRYV